MLTQDTFAHHTVSVQVQIMPEAEGLDLPQYQTAHAAGMDLRAAITEPIRLNPGGRALVTTGLRIAVPVGYEAQIRPRSGLALRQGLTLLNTPGTIDADYRGTVAVILANLGAEPVVISRGDRIAQVIICPVAVAVWEPVKSLPETERGEGGFGHTGQ